MSFASYALCFVAGLLGAAIHFFVEMRESEKTTKLGGFKFSVKQYFGDQAISLIVSFLTIALAMLLLGETIAGHDEVMSWKKSIFSFIGFSGDWIAAKVFGAFRSRLNAAIDDKTTKADALNPNPSEPTPMEMPKDKPVQP